MAHGRTRHHELKEKALRLVTEAYAARGIDVSQLGEHEEFTVARGVSTCEVLGNLRQCSYVITDTKGKASERVVFTAQGEVVPEPFLLTYALTFEDAPEVSHTLRSASLLEAIRMAEKSLAARMPR